MKIQGGPRFRPFGGCLKKSPIFKEKYFLYVAATLAAGWRVFRPRRLGPRAAAELRRRAFRLRGGARAGALEHPDGGDGRREHPADVHGRALHPRSSADDGRRLRRVELGTDRSTRPSERTPPGGVTATGVHSTRRGARSAGGFERRPLYISHGCVHSARDGR